MVHGSLRLFFFLTALLTALAGCRRSVPFDESAELVFMNEGREASKATLRELVDRHGTETITMRDPYYDRDKTFVAIPLDRVLEAAFGPSDPAMDFVFRARDGYAVPMTGTLVRSGGAYLAIFDQGAHVWEPIGPQRANPGPIYLVWKNPSEQRLETHPRPWQLAAIDRLRGAASYPHAAPKLPRDATVELGFKTFKAQCIACHAMNREGGRVGPDLNVPQAILEYRPEAQVRAYIRNPRTFRYSTMPSHPNMTDAELEGLIAYFAAMKNEKHDSEAQTKTEADAH